jgi:hypothetical protein
MAIRRTREDKEKARIRREQAVYAWKPEKQTGPEKEKPPAEKKVRRSKKSMTSATAVQPAERSFFYKDIRRSVYALTIVGLLLALAWFWLS